MNEAWYTTISPEIALTQGDLINDCPVVVWKDEPITLADGDDGEVLRTAMAAVRADVVVMTQACDLEHKKVTNVILCPHVGLNAYRALWEEEMKAKWQSPTNKAWGRHCNDIRDGFIWNLSILNSNGSQELSTDHRIVDFHEVYSVPRGFLESFIAQRHRPHLRLLPPYREHLSQAFARFFMRVGLPTPIEMVW